LYLIGVVYPSSTANNSSESQQAAFISNLFTAWDQQKAQIRWVSWLYQYDLSPAEVDTFLMNSEVIGTPQEAAARSYFQSLGVLNRNGTGSPKPAVDSLTQVMQRRNW
jgi:hypothetical protein